MGRRSAVIGFTAPHPGSFNAQLSRLNIGSSLWLETTQEGYHRRMAHVTNLTRKPDSMQHMRFKSKLYTAVGRMDGEILLVVRVTRLKDAE